MDQLSFPISVSDLILIMNCGLGVKLFWNWRDQTIWRWFMNVKWLSMIYCFNIYCLRSSTAFNYICSSEKCILLALLSLTFTCCGWLLTVFAAAITASAADGLPEIWFAANKAWWCDCTCCCCLFKWCCNCWCCKCAAATAAGKWGWWWLIVAVSDAIE